MQRQGAIRCALGCAGLASCIAALALHSSAAAQARKGQRQEPAAVAVASVQRAPHLFGTIAVPIRARRFAAEWARARRDASWHPALQALVAPARHSPRKAQIDYVQGAVHQRIRWRSDATEWGLHDYWASAVETLERGVGDMEDRAIVKMQALRLLGFPDRDLYLTLGRDKVGGPMAVLIVRGDRGFYVLDDLGGRPVPAERRQGFTPQLSFGGSSTWAHSSRSVQGNSVASAAAPE